MGEKELLVTIERMRDELLQLGIDYGLNSDITLKQSQELDRLLNHFEKIQKMSKEKNVNNTQ